jgi:NIPSNAP protein
MTKSGSIAVGIVLACLGVIIAGLQVTDVPVAAQAPARVFELRTYTANPGKFDAMKVRFRDHILPLFKKHNLTVVGFWTHADPPSSENTLVYILAHDSREAAKKNWAAFMADPVRKQVWAETEKDGPINMKVESVYLNPTDFSPIK